MTGAELQRARLKLGLTQDQLAEVMGTAQRTVGGWEQGERNGRPAPIPQPVELLICLALRYKSVRKALGLKERRAHGQEDTNPAAA